MENLSAKKLAAIDQELANLKKALNHIEIENHKTLNIKPTKLTKSDKIKVNYKLFEKKYDYDRIKTIEESQKKQPIKIKAKIDKHWLAANMDEPDVMEFYNEEEFFKPSSNFNKDYKTEQKELGQEINGIMKAICEDNYLEEMNGKGYEFINDNLF